MLNSFDEVGPIQDGGGSGGSSGAADAGSDNGGTSNTEAGSGTTDAGEGGTMMVPQGGMGGGAGEPPMPMGGEGGGENPVAPPGLIVVSGTDTDIMNGSVLSVLSPQTGKELRRDAEVVPMFAHDGIRDLWYVAVTKPGQTMGTFVFELGMRAFNRNKNEWIAQGTPIEVPAPADISANGWVALRSRFAYISKLNGVLNLVVIDATDPSNLAVQTTVTLAGGANGLIGSFGNNPGGTVNIVRTNSGCVMDATCNVTLARVQVKAIGMLSEEIGMAAIVGTVPTPNGKGTQGANRADGQDVVVTPNSDGTEGKLIQLNPNTHAPLLGEERTFPINARQLGSFAYDSCTGIAFTSELVAKTGNTTIYALPPPGGGTVGIAQPPQAAQGVFFEPYTHTLIAPFSSGNNHDILAYNVGGTTSSPKLNKRGVAQWSPPADLDPKLVAVATPYPAECE